MADGEIPADVELEFYHNIDVNSSRGFVGPALHDNGLPRRLGSNNLLSLKINTASAQDFEYGGMVGVFEHEMRHVKDFSHPLLFRLTQKYSGLLQRIQNEADWVAADYWKDPKKVEKLLSLSVDADVIIDSKLGQNVDAIRFLSEIRAWGLHESQSQELYKKIIAGKKRSERFKFYAVRAAGEHLANKTYFLYRSVKPELVYKWLPYFKK